MTQAVMAGNGVRPKRGRAPSPTQPPPPIVDAVRAAVDGLLDVDAGQWLYEVKHKVFGSWPCNDEHCPARPAWDVAAGDMFEELSKQMDGAFYGWLIGQIVPRFEAFAEQHPEAPRLAMKGGQ